MLDDGPPFSCQTVFVSPFTVEYLTPSIIDGGNAHNGLNLLIVNPAGLGAKRLNWSVPALEHPWLVVALALASPPRRRTQGPHPRERASPLHDIPLIKSPGARTPGFFILTKI